MAKRYEGDSFSLFLLYCVSSMFVEKKQIEKKDKKVLNFIFDACFDCECVNVASNNCTHSILIISEINRNRIYQRLY